MSCEIQDGFSVDVDLDVDADSEKDIDVKSKAVWKILDGVGDAVDGTVEEISAFLFERLNKQAEGGEVIINNVLLLNHYMTHSQMLGKIEYTLPAKF